MKQYLSSGQTAKLRDLGFEEPKSYSNIEWDGAEAYDYEHNYSIGELIEILDGQGIEIKNFEYWIVEHEWYTSTKDELIDALYDCVVKLKELKKL